MKQVQLQPAYVLHRRAYRESSFLIELFTPSYGRLTAIAKGVRKKGSSAPGLLQPFVPLLVSWCGKSDLMLLSHVELKTTAPALNGDCLFAGFYLNELLMYLLQKWDAHPHLFHVYDETLQALQQGILEQKYLRGFEKKLLQELGYGILSSAALKQFDADKFYRFFPEQGFVVSEQTEPVINQANLFSGKRLQAIAREAWHEPEILKDAKRLIRFVLLPLLGTKTIYSRQLFINFNTPSDEIKLDQHDEENKYA